MHYVRDEAIKPYLTIKNRLLGGADLVEDAGKGTLKLIKSHPKTVASIIGGSAILGGAPIVYNAISNKASGAKESLGDQSSRMFDVLWGNTFGTRGHGSSNYKILKKAFTR